MPLGAESGARDDNDDGGGDDQHCLRKCTRGKGKSLQKKTKTQVTQSIEI